ncbi:MAG: glycoside hydrolase family 3 C-terminal domain-containing protein [Clostridia bacterium]|nr:glycoside hydrolase family 3 C-terminal domain-containing protein [Clostridia bacterium]
MQKFLSFMKKHMGLWRILAIVFALIMMLGIVIGALLEDNKAQVNRKLGTQTEEYTVPEDSGEELYTVYQPDSKYWDSENGVTGGTTALLADHKDYGTQLSEEGSVLLKNENDTLPLATTDDDIKNLKITLFGVGSSFSGAQYGMAMGGIVEPSQSISLCDALEADGADVNEDMEAYYDGEASAALDKGYNTVSTSLTDYPSAKQYTVYEAETNSDLMTGYKSTDVGEGKTSVGIVVLSRPSTESGDYYPGSMGIDQNLGARNVLAPTTAELNEIKFAKNNCDKVVVLINSSNPMELGDLQYGDAAVDAIMWIGLPGNYGMCGVANILLGKANPSGHLADTFAYNTVSSPAMQNFGIYEYTNAPNYTYAASYYVVEAEGIYVGYKYYETRYEDSVLGKGNATSSDGAFDSQASVSWNTDNASTWNYDEEVAYSFGYGKSYTTFEQKINSVDFKEDSDGNKDYRTLTVNYTVTNTGDVAGSSVVQIYGQSPYYLEDNKTSNVDKASVQLLDYDRTPVLDAKGGENDSYTSSIDIDLDLLASYDSSVDNGDGTYGTYIMDPGTYYIALGNNEDADGAHAAINNILAKKDDTLTSSLDQTPNTSAVASFEWKSEYGDPFSTSKEGVEVSNQLDTADLNYYEPGTVTYLSRSDWSWKVDGTSSWNTSSTAWDGKTVTDYTGASNTVSNIGYMGVSVEDGSELQKQLMNETYGDSSINTHTYTYDTDTTFNADNGVTFYDVLNFDEDGNVTVADYDDEVWTKLMEELDLQEGLIFIAQGNRSYSELTGINFLGGTLTENGPVGLDVTLGGVATPWADNDNNGYHLGDVGCATLQAATFDKTLLESIGEMWGNDSLYAQIPVLWAPSLNIHRTPYNGRSAEYYSEDACVSGNSALSIVNGLNEHGFLGTIKHFALNDQESNRNGLSVFATEQQIRENELRGFQIGFEGGALATMTSFNRIGATYSGASGAMSGILRGEWQYKGYAVSDYWFWPLYMRIPESVLAGTTNFDALDYTKWDSQTLASTYANDTTMKQAVKTAVHEALYAFAHSNMVNYMTPHAYVLKLNNWWRSTYTALEIIGGIVAGLAVVAFIIGAVDKAVTKKED